MESADNKSKSQYELRIPIEQARPDESCESIGTPPSSEEVKAAVEEMNPDENSMNSRG
jgi:hypothetical protein